MIEWLLATAGTAALGAVFPVVNIELYLLGVLSTVDGLNWWAMGLAAAVGQLAGKSVFYLAGRGGLSLGNRLSRMTEKERTGRWARWFDTFQRRTRQQPWWGLGVLFLSAIPGIPPFTLMCLLSGAAGLPVLGFLGAALAGRALHFLLVAGAPGLVGQLPWFG